DPLIEILAQLRAHLCRIDRGKQIGANKFRTDRVGLGLLVILALIVAIDRHRKAEPDDESEQRERCPQDDAEVLAQAIVFGTLNPVKGSPDLRGKTQRDEREREDQERVKADRTHRLVSSPVSLL